MARRQSLDAASTLSTIRGLPEYTSRAPSVAGSDVRSISPPPFNDSASIAPSYNTNGSVILDIWDFQPSQATPETHTNVYEFSVGSRLQPNVDQPWLKWRVFSPSPPGQVIKPKCPQYSGGDDVACRVALSLSEPKSVSSIAVVVSTFGPFVPWLSLMRLQTATRNLLQTIFHHRLEI